MTALTRWRGLKDRETNAVLRCEMGPELKRAADGDPRRCKLLSKVLEIRHYLIWIDPACALVVAKRGREPFADVTEIAECFDQIERSLSTIDRKRYKLLVDVRGGPARNDPAFEQAILSHRKKLLSGFTLNAALAATAAGRLQIQRYAQSDQRQVFTTSDPAEAFRHLEVSPHDL